MCTSVCIVCYVCVWGQQCMRNCYMRGTMKKFVTAIEMCIT